MALKCLEKPFSNTTQHSLGLVVAHRGVMKKKNDADDKCLRGENREHMLLGWNYFIAVRFETESATSFIINSEHLIFLSIVHWFSYLPNVPYFHHVFFLCNIARHDRNRKLSEESWDFSFLE